MDAATAFARLQRMAAASTAPTLDEPTLWDLLNQAIRRDRYGRYADDQMYEYTVDLNWAAAEAWDLKAAQVAGDFTFQADGATYNKGDLLEHCQAMAQQFRDKIMGTSQVGQGYDRIPGVPLGMPYGVVGNL